MSESVVKLVTESIPGPKSLEVLERRKKYVSRGISNTTTVFAKRANGALIEDLDGNILLDFAAGIGVQNVGHSAPLVVEAAQNQMESLMHPCFNITPYESYIDISEKLVQLTPGNFDKKVMLANSGAEAVENSVKIARKYTKKMGILSLECAFHGRTYMAMTLTSKVKPYKNGFGPYAPETYKTPTAYCYRCPVGATYPSCGIACAEKLRTTLKGELSGDMMAALILEPVQGEGGFIVLPKEYVSAVHEICKENDILVIHDEVQAGFARTGTLFATEQFGVSPDMITLSKSIAGGIPLSAVVGRAAIMDTPNPGEIGGTYGGSPVACAAALAVLDTIEENQLCDRATAIGNQIMEFCKDLQQYYPVIGEVRGLGAMVGIEFVKNPVTKEPNKEIIPKILAYALSKGVIFMSAGIHSNVIRFLPPLVMTEQQVAYGMQILKEAIVEAI